MIGWRSIEFRLTAWYTLLLFVGFALFSVALWLGVRYGVRVSVEARLLERLERLESYVEAEADGDAAELIDEELIEFLFAVPEGHLVQVRDGAGRRVFPLGERSASSIQWRGPEAGSFFFSERIEGVPYRALITDVTLLSVPYEILMASSLESLVLMRDRLAGLLLIATPFALLICGVSGMYIARRALKPVDDVAELAAKITVGNLSSRIPVESTGDSLERLSRTFNAMLERLERSVLRIEQFSADASHELRTPISIIRTTAELALRHGRTDEEHRSDLMDIHTEAEHLTDLIEVLLTLSRQRDASAIAMVSVDLVELTTHVCGLFESRVRSKGLTLVLEVPNHPVVVRGNAASLDRLFASLIENALAHTSVGRLTVAVIEDAGVVRLTVEDTGEGIPAEALGRIFDRLYRVDAARSRSRQRFGLGLSIARRIAELHAAELTVSSSVGQGSLFTVRFNVSDRGPGAAGSTVAEIRRTRTADITAT